MIKVEKRFFEGKEYIYTYSDEDYQVRKVGTDEVYDNVYDIFEYEYEETDKKIGEIEEEQEENLLWN